MDAVKFIKERNRICKKYFPQGCAGCPLRYISGCNHLEFMRNKEEDIVSIVEKWSKEHPVETVLQDFLKKYPCAILTNGRPDFCPLVLGYPKSNFCEDCKNSISFSSSCWNSPME